MSTKKKTPRKGNPLLPQVASLLKDGICLGKASAIEKSDLSNHTPLREDFVYLNPDMMTASGIIINQHVSVCLVTEEGSVCSSVEDGDLSDRPGRVKLVLRAWPAQKLPFERVGIMKSLFACYSISDGQRVNVEKLRDRVVDASEICVLQNSNQHIPLDNAFKNYFLRVLDGRHLLPGNYLTVQYFGSLHVFSLVSATSASTADSDSVSLDRDISTFGTQLANLSLDDSTSTMDDTKCGGDSDSSFATSEVSEIRGTGKLPTTTPTTTASTTPTSTTSTKTTMAKSMETEEIGAPHRKEACCVYKVWIRTKLVVQKEDEDSVKRPAVTFADIAGLEKIKSLLLQLVKYPLENSGLFASKCIELPRAILLTGPPGTGKTLLCNALRNEVKAKCWDIDARVVMDCSLSDSVKDKIAKVFEDAQQSAPSLIIIEDVHQLCPHADVGPSETDRQTTAGLMMCLDAIHHLPAEKMVVVMATSSAVDKVDASLRRPGRFDKEIEVPIPTSIERTELLGFLVGKVHHDLKEDKICKIAEMAHGHVGGDLKALCMEAQQISLGQCLQQHNRLEFPLTNTHSSTSTGVHSSTSTGVHSSTLTGVHSFTSTSVNSSTFTNVHSSTSASLDLSDYCVRYEHFMEALHRVRPSAMREVQVEVPKVHWSDIGGLEDIKSKLKESVEWPLKHPEAFSRLGIKPPKGVLLYGPPGCSKTMIARALATESRLNFIAVKGPELFSKYVGDSERAVRQVFFRARAAAPSIVFFDEIDALAVHRKSDGGSSVADRVLAQLLTEMDGVEHLSDVLVVAATNRPDMIDKALLRPGRIDRLVYVPLPDSNTRREIFNIQFRSTPIADDVDVDGLVGRTAGYSGAEIVSVCQEAALSALHDSIRTEEVKQSHFENALETVHPQTESSTVRFYESYHKSRISSKKVFQFDGF